MYSLLLFYLMGECVTDVLVFISTSENRTLCIDNCAISGLQLTDSLHEST